MVTVEFVIVFPLVAFLIFGGIAATQLWYANRAVHTAAEEGADEARRFDGSATMAEARARDYAERLAGTEVDDLDVSASRTAETATVTVSGSVEVFGLWSVPVEETSSGPVERYVDQAGDAP